VVSGSGFETISDWCRFIGGGICGGVNWCWGIGGRGMVGWGLHEHGRGIGNELDGRGVLGLGSGLVGLHCGTESVFIGNVFDLSVNPIGVGVSVRASFISVLVTFFGLVVSVSVSVIDVIPKVVWTGFIMGFLGIRCGSVTSGRMMQAVRVAILSADRSQEESQCEDDLHDLAEADYGLEE